MEYQYHHIACGGTFDRLHAGHIAFLTFAFSSAAKVSIGITTDEMVEKVGKVGIEEFSSRKKAVVDFLEENNFSARAEIVEIDDVYGTTLSDKTIDAILVTDDSLGGADEINRKRQEMGFEPLAVVKFDFVRAEDGSVISSTYVRGGKINRQGTVYKIPGTPADFQITDDLKEKLGAPQGELFENLTEDLLAEIKSRSGLLITVGDEVTRTFLTAGIEPDLIVVDLIINRKKAFKKISELIGESKRKVIKTVNNRGTISNLLIDAICKYFDDVSPGANVFHLLGGKNGAVIEVEGEEDLAVLPIVLLAPLSTIVVYGQRGKGLVVVDVTEKKKEEFLNFLSGFKKLAVN